MDVCSERAVTVHRRLVVGTIFFVGDSDAFTTIAACIVLHQGSESA